MSIVETEKLRRFGATFNFTQQELQHGYQTSMNAYSDERAFNFFLKDTLQDEADA